MLIIIDSDGGEIECNERNSHLAYQISMNENLGGNLTISKSTSSLCDSNCYSGSSGYSNYDSGSDSGSSNSSSYD